MSLARTLMIQGTASDVGKSLLVAGLCRTLLRRGLRVAPFKAQNMSLNAAVTPEGHEIGRAQFTQAEAAQTPPHVDMNPILLKPEGEMRSQVVVMGKPLARVSPGEYYAQRRELGTVVQAALTRLRERYDVVILEGAGSPAELNLRAVDIVNMAAARMADAPVILVGDIERGGIFASLLGTLDLLEPEDRARVKGLVVNKFRGDPALFHEGVRILEQRGRVPVLGVLPYVRNLRVADEDSMALSKRRARTRRDDCLDICVLRYPSMSNFDDVLALEHEPDVVVRFVSDDASLFEADLVILPGSKSTVSDLAWLRERALHDVLHKRAQGLRPVLGVCGGFQMLGRDIQDPHGVESSVAHTSGVGLLDVSTCFEREKTTTRVRAQLAQDSYLGVRGSEVSGYEIHMGRVDAGERARPLFTITTQNGAPSQRLDGALSADGTVMGTLIHGFLADDTLRAALLSRLWQARGQARKASPTRFCADEAYDALADTLEANLDMNAIHRLVGR